MRVFIAVLVLAFASPAAAQATAPCADTTLHFEYQVDQPARWIVDTSLAVHPIPNATSAANVVQFFVDTAGAPEPRSFRPLEMTDTALVLAARRSFARWRYSPAVRQGCHVRQLMSVPIAR